MLSRPQIELLERLTDNFQKMPKTTNSDLYFLLNLDLVENKYTKGKGMEWKIKIYNISNINKICSYRGIATRKIKDLQFMVTTKSGVLNTPESPMSFEEGDFIMTGVNGELYPVKKETFLQLYDVKTDNKET